MAKTIDFDSVPVIPPEPTQLPQLAPELCGAVDMLSSGFYLVTRPTPFTLAGGVVNNPPPTYFWSKGSMQATSGRDIQKLPEGLRNKETKTFFTCDVLRGQPEPGLPGQPDQITVDGILFEVQFINDWQQLGAYHRAVLVRVTS